MFLKHIMTKTIIIYTDGSASPNPGRGGWACLLFSSTDMVHSEELYGSEPWSTNNRMELTAVIQSLQKSLKMENDKTILRIVNTDSTYVKKGITTWICTWKRNGWKTSNKTAVKNKDMWIQLDELASSIPVQWNWVKGHSTNMYNIRVDQLARQAPYL